MTISSINKTKLTFNGKLKPKVYRISWYMNPKVSFFLYYKIFPSKDQ